MFTRGMTYILEYVSHWSLHGTNVLLANTYFAKVPTVQPFVQIISSDHSIWFHNHPLATHRSPHLRHVAPPRTFRNQWDHLGFKYQNPQSGGWVHSSHRCHFQKYRYPGNITVQRNEIPGPVFPIDISRDIVARIICNINLGQRYRSTDSGKDPKGYYLLRWCHAQPGNPRPHPVSITFDCARDNYNKRISQTQKQMIVGPFAERHPRSWRPGHDCLGCGEGCPGKGIQIQGGPEERVNFVSELW